MAAARVRARAARRRLKRCISFCFFFLAWAVGGGAEAGGCADLGGCEMSRLVSWWWCERGEEWWMRRCGEGRERWRILNERLVS